MHLRGHARDRAREGRRIGADDDARRVLRRPCERRAAAAMGGDQTAEMFASGRERRRWCARAPSSSSARRTRARPCRPRRGAAIAANASREFTAVASMVRRPRTRSGTSCSGSISAAPPSAPSPRAPSNSMLLGCTTRFRMRASKASLSTETVAHAAEKSAEMPQSASSPDLSLQMLLRGGCDYGRGCSR